MGGEDCTKVKIIFARGSTSNKNKIYADLSD